MPNEILERVELQDFLEIPNNTALVSTVNTAANLIIVGM